MVVEILRKYINQEIIQENLDEYVLISDEFEKIAFEKCVERYGLLDEDESRLVRCDEDENGNVTIEEHDEDENGNVTIEEHDEDDYLIKWYRLSFDKCEKRYYAEFSDY